MLALACHTNESLWRTQITVDYRPEVRWIEFSSLLLFFFLLLYDN